MGLLNKKTEVTEEIKEDPKKKRISKKKIFTDLKKKFAIDSF